MQSTQGTSCYLYVCDILNMGGGHERESHAFLVPSPVASPHGLQDDREVCPGFHEEEVRGTRDDDQSKPKGRGIEVSKGIDT